MMFTLKRLFLLMMLGLPALALAGCGGGGGGGGGGNGGGSNRLGTLVVQLRDNADLPVEGIVYVDDQDRATTGGNVTFEQVPAGNQIVRAEVNGVETTQNVTVAANVTTTVTIRITGGGGPGTDPNNPPPPPF